MEAGPATEFMGPRAKCRACCSKVIENPKMVTAEHSATCPRCCVTARVTAVELALVGGLGYEEEEVVQRAQQVQRPRAVRVRILGWGGQKRAPLQAASKGASSQTQNTCIFHPWPCQSHSGRPSRKRPGGGATRWPLGGTEAKWLLRTLREAGKTHRHTSLLCCGFHASTEES